MGSPIRNTFLFTVSWLESIGYHYTNHHSRIARGRLCYGTIYMYVTTTTATPTDTTTTATNTTDYNDQVILEIPSYQYCAKFFSYFLAIILTA